jgi:hypothetical protein
MYLGGELGPQPVVGSGRMHAGGLLEEFDGGLLGEGDKVSSGEVFVEVVELSSNTTPTSWRLLIAFPMKPPMVPAMTATITP